MECFECGKTNNLHKHHVIPKSLGGENTITLCESCHSKVHGKDLRISALTKQALQALKAQGVKLGTPENLTKEARVKAHKAISSKARSAKANKQAFYVIAQERDRGFSYRSIALKLNEMGFKTRTGKNFTDVQVKRIESYFA